jgi:hypothetical protein
MIIEALLGADAAALYAIPVASTIIALAALGYSAITIRGSVDARRVDGLERRLETCETDRANLRNEVERMGRREIELLRLVVSLEHRISGEAP